MRAALPLLLAFLLTTGCGAAAPRPATPSSTPRMPPLTPLLDANVVAALADAAQRTGMPTSQLQVQSAESVIWRDGSLGCSQPGLAHTQALVPGLRVRIRAGDAVLDYHAGRNGLVSFCPTGRAEEPLPDDARS